MNTKNKSSYLSKFQSLAPVITEKIYDPKQSAYLALYFILSLISWRLTNFAAASAAKWLGAESFGDFSISIRWAHNLAHIFVMGQEAIILMFLSKYQNAPDKQAGLIQWICRSMIIKTVLLFSFVGFVIIALPNIDAFNSHPAKSSPLIVNLITTLGVSTLNYFKDTSLHMWVGLFAIPFIVASGIYERFFLYLKRFFTSFLPRGIYQPIFFLALIGFVSNYHPPSVQLTLILYILSFLLCTLISCATGYFSGFHLSSTKDRSDQNQWETSGLFYTFSTLIIKSTPSIALYFLEYLGPNEISVGHFNAVATLIYGYHLLTKAFDGYLKPSIAILYSSGKIEELQALIERINLIRWRIISIFTIILLIFGQYFLHDYGPSFALAYQPLCILSICCFIQYLGQPAHEILNYTGQQQALSLIMLFQFIAIAILCKLLIPTYGAVGAALAQGIPSVFATFASAYILKKRTSLKLYFFF